MCNVAGRTLLERQREQREQTKDGMDEDEPRAVQDPAGWDWENAELRSPEADVGAVIAVRFSADE